MKASQPSSPPKQYTVVRCTTPDDQLTRIQEAQSLKLIWFADSVTGHVYIALDPAGIGQAIATELPAEYQPVVGDRDLGA